MTLRDLLERVERATGPDRVLDCYFAPIACNYAKNGGRFTVVGPPTYYSPRYFFAPDPDMDWIGYDLLNTEPAYTASVDAALALIGRVLPGWGWCLRSDAECVAYGNVYPDDPNVDDVAFPARAPTPALALCVALLAAMIEQENTNG